MMIAISCFNSWWRSWCVCLGHQGSVILSTSTDIRMEGSVCHGYPNLLQKSAAYSSRIQCPHCNAIVMWEKKRPPVVMHFPDVIYQPHGFGCRWSVPEMAQWQALLSLDAALQAQVIQLYDRKFPRQIRHYLSVWIENQDW